MQAFPLPHFAATDNPTNPFAATLSGSDGLCAFGVFGNGKRRHPTRHHFSGSPDRINA
jgi:hypothetical protein